ncbi:hypothetical protein [Desulfurivibrio dismutans]|uniref:hypothetical protein n=1 Tax=Desulfurivibrio dismutans TaxID=1398908 RepID=UPI0023DA21D6|nr:hypothetical protein [Desulfurivibrio alkaliphilus]MDF1615188.1 hypothetical protein [Desulfurivibrio alkaliphilus]
MSDFEVATAFLLLRRCVMFDWRKAVGWPKSQAERRVARLILLLGLVLLLSAGCAGLRSTLLEADKRPSWLRFGQQDEKAEAVVPVVYPAGATAREGGDRGDNPMTANFGPAWQGLEPVYQDYSFNPFEP